MLNIGNVVDVELGDNITNVVIKRGVITKIYAALDGKDYIRMYSILWFDGDLIYVTEDLIISPIVASNLAEYIQSEIDDVF